MFDHATQLSHLGLCDRCSGAAITAIPAAMLIRKNAIATPITAATSPAIMASKMPPVPFCRPRCTAVSAASPRHSDGPNSCCPGARGVESRRRDPELGPSGLVEAFPLRAARCAT